MLFRRGQFMRIAQLRDSRCNSHDRPGAIPAPAAQGEGDASPRARAEHKQRNIKTRKLRVRQCCVDLPEPASRLRTKMRHGAEPDTHQPPPPVRKRRMKRSCSERMWSGMFPSIESSNASLIKLTPGECYRFPPRDVNENRPPPPRFFWPPWCSGSCKAARTRPLRIGSSSRTRP